MVRDALLNMWPMLTIVIVTLICVRVSYFRTHKNSVKFHSEFWKLIAVIYIIVLYQLVTTVDPNVTSGFNIIPFKEILRYEFSSKMFLYNVIGNILLFVPFGYMLASYSKPKHCFLNIIISCFLSFVIEFVQLNIGRSFDIDDIILNTLGGLIGYLLYVGINAIRNKVPLFKTDWFNNLICIIIIVCIALFMFKFWGINIGI